MRPRRGFVAPSASGASSPLSYQQTVYASTSPITMAPGGIVDLFDDTSWATGDPLVETELGPTSILGAYNLGVRDFLEFGCYRLEVLVEGPFETGTTTPKAFTGGDGISVEVSVAPNGGTSRSFTLAGLIQHSKLGTINSVYSTVAPAVESGLPDGGTGFIIYGGFLYVNDGGTTGSVDISPQLIITRIPSLGA